MRSTLIELLRERARQQPAQLGYKFLLDGEEESVSLSYGELDRSARRIGAYLQSIGATGERVLLLYPSGLDYIAAFFGCLYAGAIAVPAYPPRANRNLSRLQAITADAQAKFALTVAPIISKLEPLLSESPHLRALTWLTIDDIPLALEDDWCEPATTGESLAFLQYTSGSTGTPKGVMLSHRNLLHNSKLLASAFEYDVTSHVVSWLPIYHDMGLIGGILQPLHGGFASTLMSPGAFLQRPFLWLQAISRHRATLSGAPNFAYDLCVKRITAEQRALLDLSSWRVAFSGAEPVRKETLDRFAETFSSCGFKRSALYPCYGLAEATLIVSGGQTTTVPAIKTVDARALENNRVEDAEESGRALVSCGSSLLDQKIVIVDTQTLTRTAGGQVGEIWVSGQSVAQGYFNRDEESAQTFRARLADTGEGPFLRTGDLGFESDGELFITGRYKDLIIIRGLNHYPQDIELTAERSHPSLRLNCNAAFRFESDGDERLVLVQEIEYRRQPDVEAVTTAIRRAISEEHDLAPYAIVLIKAGSISKTSSGKIQRQTCRTRFLEGQLEIVGEWHTNGERPVANILESDTADENEVTRGLRRLIAERLGLQISEIDPDLPITQYGIDSLAAIELAHMAEVNLGLTLPMESFLDGRSIAQLASVALVAQTSGALPAPAPSGESPSVHPLSYGQKALWFLHRLVPDSPAYNVVSAIRLGGRLEVAALQTAFQELTNRHPSLRTTFKEAHGEPVQQVHESTAVCFQIEDASQWSAEAFDRYLVEDAHRPFDLEHGPLLRVKLLRRAKHEHVLLFAAHHIIVDFWSLGVLLHELGQLYQACVDGVPVTLPPFALQYTDHVREEFEMLSGARGEQLWNYWKEQLAGELPILELPANRTRPPVQSYRGHSYSFKLSAELTESIKHLARSQNATLFITLLAAFQALLHRYTGQKDIVVGSPAAGRSRAGLSGLVGYFVNPLPIRVDVDGGETFTTFLASVRHHVLSAFKHRDFPFALLVERLQPERDPSRSPLFQVMFALQKTPLLDKEGLSAFALGETGAKVQFAEVSFESMSLEQRTAQFDVSLRMADVDGCLSGSLEYSTDLYEAATIGRLAGHYVELLGAAVAEPGGLLRDLKLLGPGEREQLEETFNESGGSGAASLCLHELYERQAERTPEAIAVRAGDTVLSYGELNRQANQVAHYLRAQGVGVESRVGILMERTPRLLVALLGVLKAGGAYVPLDARYPVERLRYMHADAAVSVLLSEGGLAAPLALEPGRQLDLERDWPLLAGQPKTNPAGMAVAANLAYVIYTSGSTGRPKGVAITHQSAATLVEWAEQVYDAETLGQVLATTSICFDLSVFELFVPLSVGGTVLLVADALALLSEEWTQGSGARLLNTVPSAMAELVRAGRVPASVRVVNLAGEALGRRLVEQVYESGMVERVVNLYGPTEDTTYTTVAELGRTESGTPTIGRPIANTQIYILDEAQQPTPIGVAGEIYIGGAGLARGYLNRAELTAERFVPSPYGGGGERLYRTGDWGRWRGDGEVEYVGRMDQQVKVRGYRIELGEVEAGLARQAEIAEAVVVVSAGAGGEKRLVGYLVAAAGVAAGGIETEELRRKLAASLPDYMIPSVFVQLEQLPLTPNGKVDRRALPAPSSEREGRYVGSRTAVEELVAGIWSEVLGVERVGVTDNFFALGGHSLLATKVLSRMREAFGVELPLRRLFEAVTVTELAGEVEAALKSAAGGELPVAVLRAGPRPGAALPLSFAQERLWFLQQLEPESAFYNLPVAVRLHGELDREALARTFDELVRRHEVLRTSFAEEDGEAVQHIWAAGPVELPLVELTSLARAEQEAAVRRLVEAEAGVAFALAAGPLLRVRLLRLGAAEHVLVVVMHHIISDGWSLGVLVREVAALYEAYREGHESPLADLTVQYADYAVWQREWLREGALEGQLRYWREQLAGAPPVLELPSDRVRPAVQRYRGESFTFSLSAELSQQLAELSRGAGVTLYMTLLAAFQVLLARYTGVADVVVGTPIAGRGRRELEGLIGFFVNTLVLRTQLELGADFHTALRRVREVTLAAYTHQDVPFERLVDDLQPARSLSHTPLFQIMFVMQDVPQGELMLGAAHLERIEVERATSKFDLTLSMAEIRGELSGRFEYNVDLFDTATVERLSEHFQNLLTGIVHDPGQLISSLPLMTSEEKRKTLSGWNETNRAYPFTQGVQQLFEAQVEKTPDAVAVRCESVSLTYRELNRRANRLARQLRNMGVGPETLVAICMERGVDVVVAILGILKSGGAYLPLDSKLPRERLAYMLKDARVSVLLTQRRLRARLPKHAAQVVYVDRTGTTKFFDDKNPQSPSGPENLAYVIYTSGSTGQPKGVAIAHRHLLNYVNSIDETLSLPAGANYALVSTFAADLGHTMLWPALCNGSCLHVITEERAMDAEALAEYFQEHEIDCLKIVPSHLAALLSATQPERVLPRQRLIVGGEASDWELVKKLLALSADGCAVHNHYGPTETTVGVLTYRVEEPDDQKSLTLPLGRPIANTQIYVLDERAQPVPCGVTGELFIGGDSVGRGYLHHPGLTAEKFVPDSFGPTPGARLYRTGDRARQRVDGTIEFLGRVDDQIKIRGFRIELGEIEAVLGQEPAVQDAVVVAREDTPGEKRLAAYVVAQSPAQLSAAELRRHLRERLPEHMVPSDFVFVDKIPLTPNGKVDRRALPVPNAELEEVFAESLTPTQEVVASIFSQVLGVEHKSRDDDFFECGGHSLLATRMMSRVREVFKVELPLRTLFESPTVTALSEDIEAALRAQQGLETPPLLPAPRDASLPLSFAQQRLWFLDQLEPNSHSYNVPGAIRLSGSLDVSALEQAVSEIIRRHEVLRTTFMVTVNQPVQIVSPAQPLTLPVENLWQLAEEEREAEAQRLAEEESRLPFDLVTGPLVRIRLLKLAAEEHVMLCTMHHIVSDGWSRAALIREIAALYEAYASGQPSPLAELPIQYADYAVWQRDWLQGQVLDRQLAYWHEQLKGAPPQLELPTNRRRPPTRTYRGAHYLFSLPDELADKLKTLSNDEGVTLFITLLAAWQALLARYSGQEDIVVGAPIAGRSQSETENLIGFFVNTLVLRSDLSGDPAFAELLARVREMCLGAYAHQDVPFEKLVEELQPERNLSYTPLFQVMFVLQKVPQLELDSGGLHLSAFSVENQTAKFDLTLSLLDHRKNLKGDIEYNTDLFDEATIAGLASHFTTLLERIVAQPDERLSKLTLLPADEQQKLLVEWNDTAQPYSRDVCVHELFEAQTAMTPEAVALVCGSEEISYGELNRRGDQLAGYLRRLKIGPDMLVGVYAERSIDMIVGWLGTLKAGGAYVPIDTAYPRERLSFTIDDARLTVLLTQESLLEKLPPVKCHVVCLDGDWPDLAGASGDKPHRATTSNNLAYVIYTSGSTGRPKGVMIEHRSLANLLAWHRHTYGVTARDRATQLAGVSFDASVWEVWPYLTIGASVHIPSEETRMMPSKLVAWLASSGITISFMTTALAEAVLQEKWPSHIQLRSLLIGGDRLHAVTSPSGTSFKLVNNYGPTENTVVATWSEVASGSEQEPAIGRPIANTQIYILDEAQQPTPIGVAGEIYIGGAGLARGYLNRAELTAERFVPSPYGGGGERLYRTGDWGRWRGDGEVEYVGRMDQQVKVRGYRIELGEVEAGLARQAEIAEAVVVVSAGAGGEKRLVGYLVAVAGVAAGGIETEELRRKLAASLPDYMIPSVFVQLEQLPLTPNGKVDRRALPAPSSEREGRYIGSRTAVEELVAGIWSEVLGVERVGVTDNFFALGGHSLLATKVISRVREAFGVELPLRRLFEAPTVAGLSTYLELPLNGEDRPTLISLGRTPRDTELPLSFAQQRMWFLHQLETGNTSYHIPAAVRLTGKLDVAALERAVKEIVTRHESLRTTFITKEGRPTQVIAPEVNFTMPVVDLRQKSASEQEALELIDAEARCPFDLTSGPLLRARLLWLKDDEYIALLTMHHIVSDGWSMGVLIKELAALYEAFTRQEESPLAELPIQYADYAVWQRKWLQGDRLRRELTYWKNQLAGAPALMELPADRARPRVQSFQGATHSFTLPAQLSEALRHLSRREGVTLFTTLLTAFGTLLYRYTRQSDICIGTPVANRNHIETEGLIGFFVNTLVLRARFSETLTFKGLLSQMQDVTLDAYAHQDVPFERLVEKLRPERNLSYTPLFQVMFILQIAPEGALLPELTLSRVDGLGKTSKFDLTLAMVEETDGELRGVLEYSTDLYEAATIGRLAGHYVELLGAAVAEPGGLLRDLKLLGPGEREQLEETFNESGGSGAASLCLHELYERQAERTPEAIAVRAGDTVLSYGELNRQANQVAHYLRAQGVGVESRVGILMERTPRLLVALLGVLKAGGAYVPLDARYPVERLRYMHADAAVSVLLSEGGLAAPLALEPGRQLDLERDWPLLAGQPKTNPAGMAVAANLAYVIYTSGSTGRPKGVAITHQSAATLVEWAEQVYDAETLGQVLATTSICFDLSVFELFVPLSVGGTVLLVADALALLSEEWTQGSGARLLNTVPSAMAELVRAGRVPASVRVVNLAGEALGRRLVEQVYESGMVERVVNLYGPTEDTTYTTVAELGRTESGTPTIGRPIANTQIYILDEAQQPTPIGVAGEIYIGGAGLARGYLNRAELTAERFVPSPYGGGGERLYRTGDWGRWRGDGEVEYVGRMDQQVKVRGYRIELGEVEAGLARQAEIAEAVVVVSAGAGGEKRLVGYLVAAAGVAAGGIETEELRRKLAASLPDYMIPSVFVQLEQLPLTPNGKVDRRALPAPSSEREGRYVGSRTAVEELVAGIWSEVLGVERVGVTDNFFALGGHSLLATKVLSRMREAFGVELPLRRLFEAVTVTELAGEVEAALKSAAGGELPVAVLRAGPRPGAALPLSFAQERLWFLQQLEPESAFYNLPVAVRLHGELDREALARTFDELVRRHEVLRTSFAEEDGEAVQHIWAAGR